MLKWLLNFKKKITELQTSGMHLSAISREVGRSKSVISRVLKLHSEKETIKSPARLGRPRITTAWDDKAMKRCVTSDPLEIAAAISRKINANTDKDVNRFTVSHFAWMSLIHSSFSSPLQQLD